MNTVLLVDDDVTITMLFEESLPSLGYEVLGTSESGKEGLELAHKLKPDIVLMDIKMPGEMDGIQAAASIKAEVGSEIIFISGYSDEPLLDRAKLVRPIGFIHKPFSEGQIAATLKLAFFQMRQDEKVGHSPDRMPSPFSELSSSEIRIAHLVKKAYTTEQIARLLTISPATVIWHRKNIRKKLGIAGTGESLRKALAYPPQKQPFT